MQSKEETRIKKLQSFKKWRENNREHWTEYKKAWARKWRKKNPKASKALNHRYYLARKAKKEGVDN